MAWVSDSTLVAAVSNAGGMGIMGIGFTPAKIFEAEIRKAKTLTDKPFGCNLITFVPGCEREYELCLF